MKAEIDLARSASLAAAALAAAGPASRCSASVSSISSMPCSSRTQQQLIELFRVDGVVGQKLVDLVVGQVALFLARLDERLQALIQFQVHQNLLPA